MKQRFLSILIFLCIVISTLIWANYPMEHLPKDTKVDQVVVYKSKREMQLLYQNNILRTYPISMGANPIGHKEQEGDERTPEGTYMLDSRNSKSIAFLALHVSYPNKTDTEKAKLRNVSPGGLIMVHGIKNGFGWVGKLHTLWNWTNGCIAINNDEMQEFWDIVPTGTPIIIHP